MKKKVKTLRIIKEKDLDRAEDWRTTFQTFGVILITLLVAIPVGIYKGFAYAWLVIIIGFLCMTIACLAGDNKKVIKLRKLLKIRKERNMSEELKRQRYSYTADYDYKSSDKHYTHSTYKPSVTEWLGGYLVASKFFDEMFKSDNKNKY